MAFLEKIWSLLGFRKSGWKKSEDEAKIRDAVFSETSDWNAEETSRTPTAVEVAFQERLKEEEPKTAGVRKILASKKSLKECLSVPSTVSPSSASGKGVSPVKLIVGLGNPGAQYVGTRHNIGYEVLAELGRRYGVGRPKSKFQGELLEASLSGQKVLLLSPVTYMNRSGSSVRPCMDFYRIAVEDILILCDDVSLPAGKIRLRAQGSSGGQKGLGDVIRVLGTDKVARLRVGVGEKPPGWDLADYVLSKFSKEDRAVMDAAVKEATDAAALWVTSGIERSMDRYN